MPEWSGALGSASLQPVYGDLKLQTANGSSTAADPAYLAGVMGNVMEETAASGLTATKNILAGVIAKNDIQGTISSTYPAAALIAEVGDKSSAKYSVLAVMGGDTGSPTPVAMFGVDWWNSTKATEADFGLDLQGNGTHDSYKDPFYSKGDIRLGGRWGEDVVAGTDTGNDVIIRRFTGVPADGTSGTGAGVTGRGSIVVNVATGKWYRNEGTKASPTWVLFSTA